MIKYKFDILIIRKDMKLTVNERNIINDIPNNGGKLIIECYSLILENNSSINLDNIGYKGGKKGGFKVIHTKVIQ